MKIKLGIKTVLLASALVVCGVAFSLFFTRHSHQKFYSPAEVAFWIQLKGDVTVRKPSTDDFVPARSNASIVSTETARTGEDSQAEFEVLGGVRFELFDESRVLFERATNGKTRLSLLDGSLRWTGQGNLAYVEIYRQGQMIPQSQIEKEEIAAHVQTLSSHPTATLVVPTSGDETDDSAETQDNEMSASDAESRTTISQEEILNVLSVRLGQFQKCYLNLIQNSGNNKLKANVLVSFMIQPNGNVEDSRVWKSNVQDHLFLGCLSEVVARTRFKPFKGDPIRVDEFPLDFE